MYYIFKMSLRERKAADTKVGLLEALLARLDERPLSAIPVAEICEEVGVSPATFFNYFGSKQAMLVYFIQIWSVQMAAVVRAHPIEDPLGAVEALFVATAEEHARHPGIMAEIVAFQARADPAPGPPPTDAELRRAFPDQPELLEVPRGVGLDALIPPLIERAVAGCQLPPDTPVPLVFAAVASVFFGAAVLARQIPKIERAQTLPDLYRRQLRWLWAALRAEAAS